MFPDQAFGKHLPQDSVGWNLGLIHLVRGTEAVEEMYQRQAGLQRYRLGDQGEVHHLLHRVGAEQSKAGLAHGHHIGVIAKDGEPLCGKRTRSNMEDGAG